MTALSLAMTHSVWQSNIHAWVMPNGPITIEQLKGAQIVSIAAQPWQQSNFHQLFGTKIESPLTSLLKQQPNDSVVALPGYVYDRALHRPSRAYGLPEKPLEKLRESSSTVTMESESVAWARGAVEYLKLKGTPVSYPCLAITCEACIRVVLVTKENHCCAIDVQAAYGIFHQLRDASGRNPMTLVEPYLVLEGFTASVLPQEYGKNLFRFQLDIEAYVKREFSVEVKSVILGGHYVQQTNSAKTTYLSSMSLHCDGVLPEAIHLLGCHLLKGDPLSETTTYPFNDEQAPVCRLPPPLAL